MKTILITGATSGIGPEAAQQLAAEGHYLVLGGRNPRKLAAAAQSDRATGACGLDTLECDFAAQASVRQLGKAVLAQYDRIDVLANNAGGYRDPPFRDSVVESHSNTAAPAMRRTRFESIADNTPATVRSTDELISSLAVPRSLDLQRITGIKNRRVYDDSRHPHDYDRGDESCETCTDSGEVVAAVRELPTSWASPHTTKPDRA